METEGAMTTHELVIRGGTVFDGSGAPGFEADVAVDGGRISAVGAGVGRGAEEIDAKGRIVTPGFVDLHTHYDGQATWSESLDPSSLHGVTTAIMSNCGVGFAPCRPDDRDRLIRLMEGVEDIPFPVLATGLPWSWESFPEYLDSLAARRFDIDVAAQVPHAALRVYVMGRRGEDREDATEADIAEMSRLAREAIEAGALGFSTSRTLNHQTSDGRPTPTLTASEAELTGIAMALKEAGKGVLQLVSDFEDPDAEAGMLLRIVQASGRPLSLSLAQPDDRPEAWRTLLEALEMGVTAGLPLRAQVAARAIGVNLGLELTLNPFSAHPSFAAIADKPLAQKVAALRDPAFRAKLFAEEPAGNHPFITIMARLFGKMFVLGDPPDYEPTADKTVEAIAERRGVSKEEVALELMLADDGRGTLYLPLANYADGDLGPCLDMLKSPATLPGLSDGGAHVGMICDGSFPTSLLTHWTRDRTRGPKLPIEFVIQRQCRATAEWMGLMDRGLIAPGYRADLNVIDYDGLTLHAPTIQYDLPAGGRRMMQRATGYEATIVAGRIIQRHGEPTGAKPGRLVRGPQAAPNEALAAE